MKASIINRYGPPEVLQIGEIEKPSINDNQLLIENYATSVNPVDWKVRSGALKFLTGKKFPRIPGGDFTGKVVEIGENIQDFKVGDEVYGTVNALKGMAYAEYVIAAPGQVAKKPAELSFIETATLPIAGLTALQSLINLGNMKEGQKVCINGCTGGVGSFAVQIAKAKGVHVTGTCSAKNTGFAKELGTDIILDYKNEIVLATGDTYDIFFDAAAKLSYSKCKPILKKNGIYVTTVPNVTTFFLGWLINGLSSKKTKAIMVRSVTQDLEQLNELIKEQKVKPYLCAQYSFDQMDQAHKHAESGSLRGKIGVSIRER